MGIQKDIDDDVILWRYMDISKLLAILVNKELIFPRFDQFEDKLEGYPDHYINHFKSSYMESPFLGSYGIHKGYIETGLRKNLIEIINYSSYISCWHINEFESAAMWRLYCTSSDSIVIKTTVGKLKEAIASHTEMLSFGKIIYDSKYEKIKKIDKVDLSDPLFTKRESFDHEKEFRIIYRDREKLHNHINEMNDEFSEYHRKKSESGCYTTLNSETIKLLESGEYFDSSHNLRKSFFDKLRENQKIVESVEINPTSLIDEIIVSPYSPAWFVEIVEKTIFQLGYIFKIYKSDLNKLI